MCVPVCLVPVHGHIAGGVVDEVVDVIPELPGGAPTRCSKRQDGLVNVYTFVE